ncbi:MAG: hypothetical protein ACR2IJ_03440 [Fluviibacter sp.]
MASLSPPPKLQFFGSDGLPLVGGKLYTYAAGTTTPLASYTDHTGVTENTNPVILDSNGEASVWLPDTTSYKYVLKTADDVTLYTVDYISVPVTTNSFASPPVIGSGTPNAATFTTLNVTGAAIFESTADFTDPVTFDSTVEIAGKLTLDATSALKLNVGTTAQRPASPVDGDIRYNSTIAKYEGYSGSAWGQLGGGATGGGSDTIFILNGQTVTTDYTIPTSYNAGTFGPVSIASGVTVTVSTGSVWTIV